MIENKILKTYQKQLDDLNERNKLIAKELLNKEYLKSLFDFKGQFSKVFSELEDKRSWQKKAKDVGLEREYELLYEYTSSIIHCTSYSFITDLFIGSDEEILNFNALNSYLINIHTNLKKLIHADSIEVI